MSDYSCYITIVNNTYETLVTNAYGNSWGYWKSTPPGSVAPNSQSAQFQLSDSSGPSGSTGWVNISAVPGVLFSTNFDDPWSGNNSCGISMAGPARSLYSISYDAKTGSGSWQHNSCPSSGHPLYVKFNISTALPRKPTTSEMSGLQATFPNITPSSVLVFGEANPGYNCIAWSLGISYTWVNPPSPLSVFQVLYNQAANSVHSAGAPRLSWQANSNWKTQPAVFPSATIDGWGTSTTAMTHGSRLMQSADFPAAVWTSKLGQSLLITHNRQAFSGATIYGNILTSFSRAAPLPPTLVADLKERHDQIMAEEFFTEDHRNALDEAVDKIDDSKKAQFEALYAKWLAAIDEKLAFSSDTRDGARLPEFAALVALGDGILPLVVEKLCESPLTEFRLAVLYDALQPEPALRIQYGADDPNQFEGEPARALRSAKLWLGSRLMTAPR